MAKWRCEICGNEFENFHAQGFDNKIYCPLCYFKKENQELKEKLDKYENPEDMTLMMMWCTEKVKDENERLKKKYENAVSDYETTMFEKEQLKKQVENYKKLGFKYLMDKNNNLETQQKKFINYLEDMLDDENDIFSVVRVKDVLQKYKEIIGVSDDNN